MTLSTSPWWCGPVRAPGWMTTLPAQSFCAPALAVVIAAARFIPSVCGVFGSRSHPRITRTPSNFQRGGSILGAFDALILTIFLVDFAAGPQTVVLANNG